MALYRVRLLLLLALAPALLPAQDRPLGKAPFFKTFNARKLAAALTNGLPNDSLKARSIYLWTTRHIRYDVRALSRGRMSYLEPRKILFHRKAYCFGYSILYDSLCRYAGLESQVVIGYAYEPWYEARDTLFMDNHAWNAQKINGEWQLVDATWASGFVQLRAQPFRRVLWRLFHIPFRQKYKFIRKRNDFYYDSPPGQFIYTHLPGTPAWQLLPCYVPLDSFQYSPTAVMHFLRDSARTCKSGNDSIADILAEPGIRQPLEAGKQAIAYNPRNHQDISWGYWVYAKGLQVQADNKDLDRPTRILLYDSTAKQYDSAAACFLEASLDYKAERAFVLNRNSCMRRQLIDENRPLIRQQRKFRREIVGELNYSRGQLSRTAKKNSRLRKASRRFQKKAFRTHRPAKPANGEAQKIQALRDSIDANNRMLAQMSDTLQMLAFRNFAPTLARYDSSVQARSRQMEKLLFAQGTAIGMRYAAINSYDTVMIRTKGYLISSGHRLDSLHQIVPLEKEWQAVLNNREYAAVVKRMDALLAKNAAMCRKLGRMSATGFSEDSAFYAQKERYHALNDSLIRENRQLAWSCVDFAKSMNELKRMHRRAAIRYRREMIAEDWRYKSTNGFFRRHFGGYAIMMRQNASACKKMAAQARKHGRRLKQEEKKVEQQPKQPQKKPIAEM